MRLSRWAIGGGALVFVLGVFGQVSGNQPERDAVAAARQELGFDLEARFIDVGEVTLHVVLAGPENGPPVVLLHGFPEFWYAWRGPLGVLASAGFRVIVPDQRGYNLSEKPPAVDAYRVDRLAADVAGLIEALGHEDACIAGHDWGGGVAWRMVLDHPQRVRKLVVIDTPHPRAGEGFESGEERVSWYRTYLQIPWLPGWSARLGNWAMLVNALRGTSRPGTFPDAAMDQFRAAWDHDGAIHSMGKWYRADYPPLRGDGRVAAPTLVLVAAEDPYIPADLTRRSGLFLDAGEVRELGSGTHWVIQEEPERIGRILADFCSSPDRP
jgi:pimeloyl-ACP methyl ester carboxylesterase